MKDTDILFTSTDEQYVFKKYCLVDRALKQGMLHGSELFDASSIGKGREPFRPFGLCYYNDNVLVASNSLIGEYDVNSASLIRILPDTPGFVNTHQIRCFGEELYICNTAVNTLCKYNISTKETRIFDSVSCKEISEQPIPQHCRDYDRKHLNSVCKFNNKVYILLHNWSLTNSEILTIDEDSFELLDRIELSGKCCHDVLVTEENIFSLCTGNGSILKIDKKSKLQIASHKVCDSEKFWLRGLKPLNDELVVAISSRRDADTPLNAFLKLSKDDLEIIEQYNMDEVFEITDICN